MERQFNGLRKKLNEQKEYFTKEIETIKKKQTETLELKKSINEIKNALKNIGKRADKMDERISKLTDKNLEMAQVEEERKLKVLEMKELYENCLNPIRKKNRNIKGTPAGEEKRELIQTNNR